MEWLSVIDKEDDPHVFLGEEDDYTEDWPSGDEAVLDGEETERVSNTGGTVLAGHRVPTAPCREALR